MMVWIPALGGLISGLLVFTFAPEAEGHGTDAMIDSFHRKKGVIRRRVPVIKTIASAITIGSGGSAGKEGSHRPDRRGVRLAPRLPSESERQGAAHHAPRGGSGRNRRHLQGALWVRPSSRPRFSTGERLSNSRPSFPASSLRSSASWSLPSMTAMRRIFHIPRLDLATPAQFPFYAVLGVLCAVVGFLTSGFSTGRAIGSSGGSISPAT